MIIKKLKEHMDFKNLAKRLIFSLFIISCYLFSLMDLSYLLFLGIIIYLCIFYEIYFNFVKFKLLILFYLFISLFFYYIYIQNYFTFFQFNLLIFTIVMFDSFSYFTGVLLGRKYIFKNISPKKTLEGYLGGVIFTNFFLILYIYINTSQIDYKEALVLTNVFIILALLGDLFESFLKRKNNIKDSSNFIPGHGGFFDRFDSFIPNIIFLTIYCATVS